MSALLALPDELLQHTLRPLFLVDRHAVAKLVRSSKGLLNRLVPRTGGKRLADAMEDLLMVLLGELLPPVVPPALIGTGRDGIRARTKALGQHCKMLVRREKAKFRGKDGFQLLGRDMLPVALRIQIARAYMVMVDPMVAERLLRQALNETRRTLGNRHEYTIIAIGDLAQILMNNSPGYLNESERLHREQLQLCREVYGETHASTLKAMGALSSLLLVKGDLAGAEPLGRASLQGFRDTIGDKKEETLDAMMYLASLLGQKGEMEEPGGLLREAVAGMREVLGSQHESTLMAINMFGGYLMSVKGDLAAAEPLMREALAGLEVIHGLARVTTQQTAEQLVTCLRMRGDHAGAASVEEKFGFGDVPWDDWVG